MSAPRAPRRRRAGAAQTLTRALTAAALVLAALSGCKDKCKSLAPQAEIAMDFGSHDRSEVTALRVEVRLDNGKPYTKEIQAGSLFFDGQVGKFTLTFDNTHVPSGGVELRVDVTGLKNGKPQGARAATQQRISPDACNFITLELDMPTGDGNPGDARPPDASLPLVVDIDKEPTQTRVAETAAVNKIISCDFDGDKYPDIVIARATHDTTKDQNVGRVSVYLNADNSALAKKGSLEVYGAGNGDILGTDIACGDLDGDFKDDLIVGAPGTITGGRVYVFSSGDGLAGELRLADDPKPKELLFTVDGILSGDLGTALATARTAAGLSLVIGAPGVQKAFVVFGRKTWPDKNKKIDLSQLPLAANDVAEIAVSGNLTNSRFGGRVAAGALTKDPDNDDVVIAANQATNGAKTAAGQVSIYHLDGTTKTVGQQVLHIWGPSSQAKFGSALAIGDLDRDGTVDLLVGAPNVDLGDSLRAGFVYLIAGDSSMLTQSSVRNIEAKDYKVAFRGPGGAEFGSAIAARPTGNKLEVDLLVGAPDFDNRRGAVYHITGSGGYADKTEIDVTRAKSTQRILRGLHNMRLGFGVTSGLFGTANAKFDLFVTAPGDRAAYLVELP